MGNPIESAKKWLFSIALKKVITRAIPWLVSLIGTFATKAATQTETVGVSITIDDAALATAIASGLAFIQNWIKTKFDIKWL